MVNRSDVRREIGEFLDLLFRADIALLVQPVVEQTLRAKGTIRVTTAGLDKTSTAMFRGRSATPTEYRSWLKHQAYSTVLYDGALIQLSYDFRRNDLIAHRLAYYPCPFNVDQNLFNSLPIEDVIDLYLAETAEEVQLRSPLRFDYNIEAYSTMHPTSHLTFLWDHCRWAVVAPLSLGHFVRFIFRHFYPHLWEVHQFLREWPQELGNRTISEEEENLLHVSCTRAIRR